MDRRRRHRAIQSSAQTTTQATRRTVALTVDGAYWNVLPIHHYTGVAGSNMWWAFVLVGSNSYLYWSHAADTPAGVVQCGPNPGSAVLSAAIAGFSALAGRTGYRVDLPAGTSTPSEHATLVANTLATIPGVVSATPRSPNSDGGVTIDVVTTGATLTVGSTSWGSQGALGTYGGPHYRMTRTGDGPTVTSVDITATIGSALEAPTANAIPTNVSMILGTTVSTASTARPRLHARRLATPGTDPAASTVLQDFGQIPASEIVAGAIASIWLTESQIDSLYTALHTTLSSGQLWLAATATGGCHYASCSTGNTVSRGQQVQQNLRTAANNDPTVAPPATWTTNGSFGVWLGARIGYRVNPATSGECRVRLMSVDTLANHASPVTLPDSYTCQGTILGGTVGMRVRRVNMGINSGSVRVALHTGGDVTLPGVSAVGATVLADLGTNGAATGDVEYLAPTGASTVRVPAAGLWVTFYGLNAVGRGEVGPSPFVVAGINLPASHVTIGGGSNGNQEREQDVAQAGLGDASIAPVTVPNGTLTVVDNCPYIQLEMHTPALVAA